MNWVPPLSWLMSITRRRGRSPQQPDFADLGTAFGLDACLGEPAVVPLPKVRPRKGRVVAGVPLK